jgi:cytochrome P450
MHAALTHDGAVVAEGLPGPAFARHMLSADPPDHTRLRTLASAAFSRSRVGALRPRVQAIVDALLDELDGRGDTVVPVFGLAAVWTHRQALGVDLNDQRGRPTEPTGRTCR